MNYKCYLWSLMFYSKRFDVCNFEMKLHGITCKGLLLIRICVSVLSTINRVKLTFVSRIFFLNFTNPKINWFERKDLSRFTI